MIEPIHRRVNSSWTATPWGWCTELRNDDGQPNFREWGIRVPGQMVGLAVHHLPVADQRETPHGHPWPFVSIILSGGYTELVRADDGDTIRTWRAGSFHLFPTWLTHRVIAVEPETWTLVVHPLN